MRQAIHYAAGRIGPCWSISHLMGTEAQVFRVIAGTPSQVQEILSAEVTRRFHAPPFAPVRSHYCGEQPLARRPDAELQGDYFNTARPAVPAAY